MNAENKIYAMHKRYLCIVYAGRLDISGIPISYQNTTTYSLEIIIIIWHLAKK